MLGRALLIWSSVIVVAVNVPTVFGLTGKKAVAKHDSEIAAEVMSVSAVTNARSYVLKSNSQGHFEGKFRLNGKSLPAMIDTGATFVTLNEADARNLGYGGNELRFRYEVSTANGKVKAARVVLKSVEIGTVTVRNVDAIVIRGKALNFPLIGMSFMKKLDSYSAENDELRLVN